MKRARWALAVNLFAALLLWAPRSTTAAPRQRWKAFRAYPGARRLCSQHVSGNGMHINWTLYATHDAPPRVRRFYEQHKEGATVERKRGKVVGLRANKKQVLSIHGAKEKVPTCGTAPSPSDKTLIVVSQATLAAAAIMPGFGEREWTILLVLLAFVLIPQIISIVVYHRVLGALPAERRLISARSTFLLLIPFFSTIYEFYVVLRLSRSLQDYFAIVEEPKTGGCGRWLGVSFCLCNAGGLIPGVGIAFGVLGLLLWIVYMLTVLELRQVVQSSRERYAATR